MQDVDPRMRDSVSDAVCCGEACLDRSRIHELSPLRDSYQQRRGLTHCTRNQVPDILGEAAPASIAAEARIASTLQANTLIRPLNQPPEPGCRPWRGHRSERTAWIPAPLNHRGTLSHAGATQRKRPRCITDRAPRFLAPAALRGRAALRFERPETDPGFLRRP